MTNALLDRHSLPRFDELLPDDIASALDHAISEHESIVATITRTRPATFASAWLPYERASTALDAIWSTVSHLQGVADTAELRAEHAAGQRRLVANAMKVDQNRDLYDVLAALTTSPAFANLALEDRVAVEHAVRGFTLSGVALDTDARARFATISMELSDLSNQFGSAVLDATEAWSEAVTDPALLTGLSEVDMAMLRAVATSKGQEGWLVTLQRPSVDAILTFASNRDLRERVYRAFGTRASDQGPQAGMFDNSDRIARILALRHEAATLLGFADPVAWSLAEKMASNASEVIAFLRDLARRARPSAERELAELAAYAAERLDISDLQPWDMTFASNALRQERYVIDEQEIRAYFPVDRVVQGWQTLLNRLFGIRMVERGDVSLYHDDVRFFDVVDEQGAVFAGLYVDLYARAGKRGGAWMSRARPRLRDGDVSTVPVAYLVCNFPPAGADNPSLLSHGDVRTLLHETGHCLHLLFTQVNRPSISGTSGFEWDAIELPSQLMEDFAWDRDVLTGMSGHVDDGGALPADLFDRMLKARHFQSGQFILRQVEFALFDLLLHLGTMGSDPMAVIEAVRDEVAVVRPPAWHRFPHAFSHIFAGGYAAGYYGYLWAELLAADAFQGFAEAGLVDRATGNRFRTEVLARGATRPAADSFRAFRGRDPEPTALLERHGL